MSETETLGSELVAATDLSTWLGEPVSGTEDTGRAEGCINYAFILVEEETERDPAYWKTQGLPEAVKHVVLQAAARGYTNPESFTNERVDDFGGGGRPVTELGMYLTATEKRIVARFAQARSFGIGVIDTYKDDPEPLPPWFDPVTGGINDWG